ncbi:UNVERIFIED_CONTAM: hypothetical protein K2H54_061089 [Gekko kuhli]
MLSLLKKRVQEGVCAIPPTMEVTESSPSLEDPRQSPLEVSGESAHGEQPLGNPGTELLDMEGIPRCSSESEAEQESLLSEMAKLRNSVSQMKKQLKETESRLSSLEDRVCESQQTNSVVSASQSDPRAVPASSLSSFSSQQMILDAAQTAPSPTSPSVYSGDASSKPPLSSSEQFKNTSSTLRYSEIAEKAHQMHADTWSQEMNVASETAHLEAEESDNQEGTFSRTSSLITQEYETLTSTEETALPAITAVRSLERISESETALARAKESDQQEDTSSRALPSIAPEYEANPQPLTSTEETALRVIAAVGSQETNAERETAHTEPEESDQQANNFSGGSAQAYTPESQPLMRSLLETPQATALDTMQKEAQERDALLSKRRSTNKRSSSTALTRTSASAGTLSCLPSSPPAKVRPLTKRRQTSIAWIYFTKKPKNIATCRVCAEDVQAGKIGARGNVGTAALLRHLEHKHKIPCIAWKHFKKWSKFSAICRFCKEIVNIGKIGCGNVGTAALLSHVKNKHKTPQEKMEPPVGPGAQSKMQDAERPTTNESPSSTTSAASTSTTNTPVMLSCLSSSSPTEVRPPTKGRRTSIVWQHFTELSKFKATCNHCKEDVKIGKIGGCGVVGTAALLSHLKRKHGIIREKVAVSVVLAAASKIQDVEISSTTEGPSGTTSAASTSPTTSPVTPSCLPSSSPREVRPPTKCHRQTSIAWIYFKKQSKNIATCRVCAEDVQAGKIGGCGNVGTAALLRHLEHKHEIPSIVWKHFKKWSKFSAICRFCKEIVNIGKIGCGNVGTARLLSHIKNKHKTPQEKKTPPPLQ